jgi:hypothetical protein
MLKMRLSKIINCILGKSAELQEFVDFSEKLED